MGIMIIIMIMVIVKMIIVMIMNTVNYFQRPWRIGIIRYLAKNLRNLF